ncbi:tyrosine-type recombinase/integrase [Thermodesulfobacteriota bacterium]
MAIMAECPICRRKQSKRNKVCKCGEDLDRAKRSKRVKYWIQYRLPDKTQRKEYVGSFEELNGYSIEDARIAESKRKTQKKENKLMDIKADSKMTYSELAKWYLNLEKVKNLASFGTIKVNIEKFNDEFGGSIISHTKPVNLENYQVKLKKEGKAPATIDHRIGKTKTMIFKAFDNDLISGDTLKVFRKVKKTLKRGSDVRDRVLSVAEFGALFDQAKDYLKPILAIGYYTGMRRGEIMNLTWDKVDLVNRMIRLESTDTKDKEARNIPICDELFDILISLPTRIQGSDKDDHVFQYRGSLIKGDIRDSLKQACQAAGIKYGRFKKGGFIFHDLRHTFNTNMRKAGVSESVIMEITGHSSREMFDRYNRIDEEDTQKAIEQLEVFLKNAGRVVGKDEKKKGKKATRPN